MRLHAADRSWMLRPRTHGKLAIRRIADSDMNCTKSTDWIQTDGRTDRAHAKESQRYRKDRDRSDDEEDEKCIRDRKDGG